MIIKSISRIEKSTSAMVRVMSQWRDSGRARIRSAKPVSISEAGSVASVMASASSAMMKPVSKYTAITMPLNDMMLAREGPRMSRTACGSSAAELVELPGVMHLGRDADPQRLDGREQQSRRAEQHPDAFEREPEQQERAAHEASSR